MEAEELPCTSSASSSDSCSDSESLCEEVRRPGYDIRTEVLFIFTATLPLVFFIQLLNMGGRILHV